MNLFSNKFHLYLTPIDPESGEIRLEALLNPSFDTHLIKELVPLQALAVGFASATGLPLKFDSNGIILPILPIINKSGKLNSFTLDGKRGIAFLEQQKQQIMRLRTLNFKRNIFASVSWNIGEMDWINPILVKTADFSWLEGLKSCYSAFATGHYEYFTYDKAKNTLRGILTNKNLLELAREVNRKKQDRYEGIVQVGEWTTIL